MPEIGATLREARMRARIDVSEIEAQTKIRSRYLRALENEEWDLLPGPTFIKSFLRTYATALGLDGKALVEEYRRNYELGGESDLQPPLSARRRSQPGRRPEPGDPGRPPRGSRGYAIAIGLAIVVVLLLAIGLLAQSSSKPKGASATRTDTTTTRRARTGARHTRHRAQQRHGAPGTGVSTGAQATVSLQATSTVWVCLVGEGAEKLVPGVDMQAGESDGPFHAKRFDLTLGNNAVTLQVNGKTVPVPESTQAIGYSITSAGVQTLPPESQPTCA